MVFFLQRRIQPLQARVSKLWTYSGLIDPSWVSPKNPEKKDLEKRVRSLTTLTAKMVVPACLAVPFDSTHPLPKVIDLQLLLSMLSWLSIADTLSLPCYKVTVYWLHVPPSLRRAHCCWRFSWWLWSPWAFENQDGDGAKGSLEGSDSTQSPPPVESKDHGACNKRKRPETWLPRVHLSRKMYRRSNQLPRILMPLYSTSLKLTRKFLFSSHQ
jgi:hypothetical protein